MTQPTADRNSTRKPLIEFLTLWGQERTWRSALYLLLGLPLGIVYFTFVVTAVSVSGGLLVIYAGIPLLALTFIGARVLTKLDADIANVLQGANIVLPQIPWTGEGNLWARAKRTLADQATWKGFAYLIAMLPVGIFNFTITVTLVAAAFFGTTVWIWSDWTYIDVSWQLESLVDISWRYESTVDVPWALEGLVMISGVLLLIATPGILILLASAQGRFAHKMLSDPDAAGGKPAPRFEAPLALEARMERAARSRVLELKLFYLHASLFVGINVLLAIIDLASGGGQWFYWSLIGWGTGLGVHAATVYMPFFGEGWYEQKARELLQPGNEKRE